jgi:hypothetical protein
LNNREGLEAFTKASTKYSRLRLLRVGHAATFVVAVLVSSVFAQDWIEYVDRTDRFGVSLPAKPTVQETTYTSWRGAKLPARIHSVRVGGSTYSVTVVNYESDSKDITDILGSIDFAAWNFRKRGGEVTFDAYEQMDRIPGHELHITNPDRSLTFAAINLYDRRLYILEATVPPGAAPPQEFQQSLVILDADGKRVRFELDANGNRVSRVPNP